MYMLYNTVCFYYFHRVVSPSGKQEPTQVKLNKASFDLNRIAASIREFSGRIISKIKRLLYFRSPSGDRIASCIHWKHCVIT